MWLIMTQLSWAVVYNAWQDLVSLLCTGWLIMAQLGQAVVYHVANNDIAQPGSGMAGLSQPVVYWVANNGTAQLDCYVPCD
jgi:hypothetical protein